ncbi:MAG: hypothetical protein P1P88_24925, partial [Bacteroidales bacterium]|nr:hypothetical protein [Bacteroidales bacterium]
MMKKIYLCLLLFSVSIYSFSQNEKWRQKNARINFVVATQGEFLKIAGNYSPAASVSASIAFNETYFVGIYGSMKVLPTFSEYPVAPGVKYDARFQHGGLEGVYSLKLGL